MRLPSQKHQPLRVAQLHNADKRKVFTPNKEGVFLVELACYTWKITVGISRPFDLESDEEWSACTIQEWQISVFSRYTCSRTARGWLKGTKPVIPKVSSVMARKDTHTTHAMTTMHSNGKGNLGGGVKAHKI